MNELFTYNLCRTSSQTTFEEEALVFHLNIGKR